MSIPHKSFAVPKNLKFSALTTKNNELHASGQIKESIFSTKTNTSTKSSSNFAGRGSALFLKSAPVDITKEPLGIYYEDRKKIIFGKINLIEEEFFVSQFLLNSQKKINNEYIKIASSSGFFSDVPQNAYTFTLAVKENILNFCLVIKLYLSLNNKEKALEIFLIMCKENKKKLEFIYNKINTYCKKTGSAMRKFSPPMAKILISLLSCLIKLSIKFCKTSLINFFFLIYIKTIFCVIQRESKPINSLEYRNELKSNRLFIYNDCLFNSAVFYFYNYYPLNTCIQLLQHILEFYDNSIEKNNYELVLMMKANFNSGFFYFVEGMLKESVNCLNAAKELISEIIQNNINEKDDEKEIFTDLNANTFLKEEKNPLFCLKIDNHRVSKLHDKSKNLYKFINENSKKANSFVLGSKKYKLKLPLIFEKIKIKIVMEIDLLLCQIEMYKKNYKEAWEQINAILKSNTTIDNIDTKSLSKRKKFGVNKTFKSLKTYQNINTNSLIKENINDNIDKSILDESELKLIYLLLEKIEHEIGENESDEKPFALKRRNNLRNNTSISINSNFKITSSNYTSFKEMEKFFIFICNLSIFQLKILNETQPEYSKKRDELPIIFSTPFRDCLTNAQRMDLDKLETMSLSRFIILIDSRKDIEPENLDYKYMKYKIKTPVPDSDEEKECDLPISFDEDNYKKGRNRNRKYVKSLNSLSTSSHNVSSLTKNYAFRKISTNTSKKLSFDNIEEDNLKLEIALQQIKTEKNKKFMNKYKKKIRVYFEGLNEHEKEIFINSPNLLKKIMENAEKKIEKNKNKENKDINKDKMSICYSYEISQNNSNK